MGDCVTKIVHEGCSTSPTLQVFEQEDGTRDGFCFKCGASFDTDPLNGAEVEFVPKTDAEKQAEVDEVTRTYGTEPLPARMLSQHTMKYFGVKVAVSEQDGVTPTAVAFPYGRDGKLVAYKFRILADKRRQWSIGSIKGCDLFGWGRAVRTGSRKLFITEGEYDAMALYQVLMSGKREEHKQYVEAVVSVTNGAGGALKQLQRAAKEIERHFDEVILCFDMDEAGQDAATAICKHFPDWKIAALPCKDANEALLEGASRALANAVLFRSERPKNSRMVGPEDLYELARKRPEMGLSTPWEGLTRATRGFHRGHTYYWGAGVKMGKSEIVNALAAHMIKEHGCPVYLAKPEEAPAKSLKLLAGKMVGKIFHDPEVEFDEEAFDRAYQMLQEKVKFTDVYQHLDWNLLQEDIKYARHELGMQDIIIDPITCFTNTMNAAQANEFLTSMAADASVLAKDLDLTIHLFCHLKAPDNGDSHERGGKVLSNQFAGSRAMMRSCNYMIGMEGNKDPDLSLEERNRRTLKVLEDREFGTTASIPLYWNYKNGLFTEMAA